MKNSSIFAAFERMWQHVVVAISGKADTSHTHSVATNDGINGVDGFMSSSDKAFIMQLQPDNLILGGINTVSALKPLLAAWLSDYRNIVTGAKCYFIADSSFVDMWNDGANEDSISGDQQWSVELVSSCINHNNSITGNVSALLRFTTYADSAVYYVSIENGTWGNIKKVSFANTVIGNVGGTTGGTTFPGITTGGSLPSVTAADNGKVLMVVDGTWQAVALPNAAEATF
jgi:hypothetical protein